MHKKTPTTIIILAVFVALASGALHAEEAPFSPPTALFIPDPIYPPDAFLEGVKGRVEMQVDIATDGGVDRVAVLQSPDPRLTWSAFGAVTQMQFEPARMGEKPIPVRVNYALTFTIDEAVRERLLSEREAADLAKAREEKKEEAPVNLEGRVFQAGQRKVVEGALVFVPDTELETLTDEEGRFELRGVPAGKQILKVQRAGYRPYATELSFKANERTEAILYLQPDAEDTYEVIVRRRRAQKEVTRHVLTQKEITRVPGTFGDPVRVIQRLPGVARAPYGLGAVVVRGGAPDDSVILIDGHLTRYLFHLGAGPSVINADLIEQLEFYPGGFGVRFGRAHAGAVEVKTRDPNKENFSGKGTVDLLQTGFRFEGPILGGAVFLAARRSYTADVLVISDVVRSFVDTQGTRFTIAPRYQDAQAKAVWNLGLGHSVAFNLLSARDTLDLAFDASELGPSAPSDVGIETGFFRLNPVWRYKANIKTGDQPFFEAYVSPMFQNSFFINRFDESAFDLFTDRYALRAEATLRPFSWLDFTAGTDTIGADFRSTVDVPGVAPDERLFPRPTVSDPPRLVFEDATFGYGSGYYAELAARLWGFQVVAGLRADLWQYLDQTRSALDPRVALRYEVLSGFFVKGSAGLYHKMPTPPELSKEVGNPDLPLESGVQYSLGTEVSLTRSLEAQWEVFYRDLFDLPVPVTSFASFSPGDEPRIQPVGEGRVYGSEVLLRQRLDAGFFGWVAYTLMRAERRYFDEVEEGETPPWYLFSLDQTHILSVAASYQLPWGFELGAAMRFISGNPETFAAGGIFDADRGRYLSIRGPYLGARLPAFFQLDVRLDKTFTFDTWTLAFFVDVQNATNHTNYEFFQYSYDYARVEGFPGIPFIPVVGMEGAF
jgi:TonB family protein